MKNTKHSPRAARTGGRAVTGSPEYRHAKDGTPLGWYGRLSVPGGRVRIKLGDWPNSEQGRERAKEKAKALIEQVHERGWGVVPVAKAKNGKHVKMPGETVEQWSERWLRERRARGLTSVGADESRLRVHILPRIGALPMTEVTRDDLENIVDALDAIVSEEEMSWRTAEHIWHNVSKMFDDAARSKNRSLRVRPDNPARDVRGPEKGIVKAKQYLYPSEFLRLMECEAVSLDFRRKLALAVYLFPRAGELEALEWSDVDLEHGVIHVHRAMDRSADDDSTKSTKGGEGRRFAMEPNILPLLRAMHAESGGEGRVIDLGRDLPRYLRKSLKRAGITREALFITDLTRKQITFHDMRATGLTWMAVRGDPPLTIKQRAGHANFKTTEGYIREAEAVRQGFGDVFPPLPASVVGTGGASAPQGNLPSQSPGNGQSSSQRAGPGGLPRQLLDSIDGECTPIGAPAAPTPAPKCPTLTPVGKRPGMPLPKRAHGQAGSNNGASIADAERPSQRPAGNGAAHPPRTAGNATMDQPGAATAVGLRHVTTAALERAFLLAMRAGDSALADLVDRELARREEARMKKSS